MTIEVLSEESWPTESRAAVFAVRQRARELALSLGFTVRAAEAVTIAISELASNIVDHAKAGVVVMQAVRVGERLSFVGLARDNGPGIRDVAWAMADGSTTGTGLGCGLSAAKRLMDEFHIETSPGAGTVITVRKWVESPASRMAGRTWVHAGS
jgi:serine/threonine-protein kinase RsbT